jgi:hypothetical protein
LGVGGLLHVATNGSKAKPGFTGKLEWLICVPNLAVIKNTSGQANQLVGVNYSRYIH